MSHHRSWPTVIPRPDRIWRGQKRNETADAGDDRRPRDLRRVEAALRTVADRLAAAGDPSASSAWLSLACLTRYQSGRRDETLSALIEALYWDRGNEQAWYELVDTPPQPRMCHVACASRTCPPVVGRACSVSYYPYRRGATGLRAASAAGIRLRNGLLDIAESQDDRATIAALAGYAGLAAEKAGHLNAAVGFWRRAIAAGSTDEKVADRFSVWLANRHDYPEAARVLRQALAANPDSANVAERMRRRLVRCEQMRAPAPQPSSRVTSTQEHAEFETLVCGECGQAFRRSRTRGRKPLRCPNCISRHLTVP